MGEPLYLDHHATTPLDERVLAKMLPYFTEIYGNSSSIDHLHGHRAKTSVDAARQSIAKLLGCRKANEIIFTSGATESNNLALQGVFRKLQGKGNHLIASAIEHPAVLDVLKALEKDGAEITLLPVDNNGVVDLPALQEAIRPETSLISVMFANNEIGTIQPIKEIGAIAKARGVLFHVDAAQAVGHEPVHVYELDIDLLSFSAHKFYGPKGIGGLFVRSFSPMVRLEPVIFGGGQERNFRPGTLNVPGIIGMAAALEFAVAEQKSVKKRVAQIRNNIERQLCATFPDIKVNGHPGQRLAHNLNLTIPGVEAKALIHLLKDKLSFSAGSACSSTKVEPSHVLKALGLSDEECFQTIRIGLGKSVENSLLIVDILKDGLTDLGK